MSTFPTAYLGLALVVAIGSTVVDMVLDAKDPSRRDRKPPSAVVGVTFGFAWPLALFAVPVVLIHFVAKLIAYPVIRWIEHAQDTG